MKLRTLQPILIIYILAVMIGRPITDAIYRDAPAAPFLARWSVLVGLPVATLIAALSFVIFRNKSRRAKVLSGIVGRDDESDVLPADRSDRVASWLIGLAVVCAGVVICELRHPFCFTQDDAYSFSLPTILAACRSLFRGVFFVWNPYVLMGAPAATNPNCMVTYPLIYPFYWIAARLFGNENATVEVLSIFNILMAYIGVYWVARIVGLRPKLAAAGGVCIALSGFYLILGASWVNITSTAVWMVILLASAVQMHKGRVGWKWAIWTGAAIGFSFYAGHIQEWIYNLIAYGVALAVIGLSGSVRRHHLAWLIPAVLIGGATAAPLLVTDGLESLHFYKGRAETTVGQPIQQGSPNLLLPYPLGRAGRSPAHVQDYGPLGWGTVDYEKMGDFFFSGGIFYWVALLAAVFAIREPWTRKMVRRNPWLVCALILIIYLMGKEGGIWLLVDDLPVFDKFRGPFKMLTHLDMFVVLGSGLMIERWLRASTRQKAWGTGLACFAGAVMLYHCAIGLPSFYTWGARPYPKLPQEISGLIANGNHSTRFMPMEPPRSIDPDFPLSMGLDFASAYGTMTPFGYDPMVEATSQNRQMKENWEKNFGQSVLEYSVEWVVASDLTASPVLGPNANVHCVEETPNGAALLDSYRKVLPLTAKVRGTSVFHVGTVRPMAFAWSAATKPLPVRFNGHGAKVDVSGLGDVNVTVNMLHREWMRAYADGKPVSLRPDDWVRMVAAVPAGAKVLEISYEPPWFIGIICGCVLLVLGVAAGVMLARKSKSEESENDDDLSDRPETDRAGSDQASGVCAAAGEAGHIPD